MNVRLSSKAEKEHKNLNQPILGKVDKALLDLESEPPKGDIRPLTGTDNFYRRHVSWLRILFTVVDNEILVTDIVPRGQAYTKKTLEGKR